MPPFCFPMATWFQQSIRPPKPISGRPWPPAMPSRAGCARRMLVARAPPAMPSITPCVTCFRAPPTVYPQPLLSTGSVAAQGGRLQAEVFEPRRARTPTVSWASLQPAHCTTSRRPSRKRHSGSTLMSTQLCVRAWMEQMGACWSVCGVCGWMDRGMTPLQPARQSALLGAPRLACMQPEARTRFMECQQAYQTLLGRAGKTRGRGATAGTAQTPKETEFWSWDWMGTGQQEDSYSLGGFFCVCGCGCGCGWVGGWEGKEKGGGREALHAGPQVYCWERLRCVGQVMLLRQAGCQWCELRTVPSPVRCRGCASGRGTGAQVLSGAAEGQQRRDHHRVGRSRGHRRGLSRVPGGGAGAVGVMQLPRWTWGGCRVLAFVALTVAQLIGLPRPRRALTAEPGAQAECRCRNRGRGASGGNGAAQARLDGGAGRRGPRRAPLRVRRR